MQTGVDVVVCLHQCFQAYLSGTTQQRVIGANVQFDITFACLVVSIFVFKGWVNNSACKLSLTLFAIDAITTVVKKFIFYVRTIKRVGGSILLSRCSIFTWHSMLHILSE